MKVRLLIYRNLKLIDNNQPPFLQKLPFYPLKIVIVHKQH